MKKILYLDFDGVLVTDRGQKYHLETNFDSTSIDSIKELTDIFAKIIMEADMQPQHVLTKLKEKFTNR